MGSTICGNRPVGSGGNDLREPSYGVMNTFSFRWRKGSKGKKGELGINRSGTKNAKTQASTSSGQGCGKSINWSSMKQVPVPEELMEGKITTDDVKDLPPAGSGFVESVATLLSDYKDKMTLGNKPTKTNPLSRVFKR